MTLALLSVAGFVALWGCATGPGVAAGSRYMVTAPRAQFYKYGPAQSFGPDFVLNKGQKVTMLETSFGFSRVMTEEGVSGFVASDEVGPAPPEPKATPPPKGTPSPKGRSFSGKPKRSDVESTPGSPLFEVSDAPPLPQNPDPAPPFRF